jgi:hypothetical protein
MKKLIFYSSFLLILVCAFFSISYKYHTEIWGITSLETTTLITKNLYEDDCDACKRCEGIRYYGIFVVKYDDSTTEALCVSKEIYMSYNISDCYVVEKSNGIQRSAFYFSKSQKNLIDLKTSLGDSLIDERDGL